MKRKRPSSSRPAGGSRPRRSARAGKPGPRPGPGGGAPVWLYGLHAALGALANPRRRCRRLVVTAQTRRTLEPRLAELAAAGRPLPALEQVARDDIAALLARGAVHQGVAVMADSLPEPPLSEILDACAGRDAAVVVVLDQVTDPHNVGAVLRSAGAFGAIAVVVTERHAPGETGALAKAASGALESVPLLRVANLVRALNDFKAAGFWCAGLDPAADRTLAGAGLEGRIALVLGAEGKGLRRLTGERCDLLVRLPITGAVESLNVSAAAAIALYELARKT